MRLVQLPAGERDFCCRSGFSVNYAGMGGTGAGLHPGAAVVEILSNGGEDMDRRKYDAFGKHVE